jgi:hypothetical protein
MQLAENDWISKRAYTLWEKEGHPDGRDFDHWEQASKEFSLLTTSVATKPAAKKKAVAAKTVAAVEVTEKPKARPRKTAAK